MENQGKRYDKIATSFAALRDSFSTEKKYIDLFMQFIEPESHVLDVGCGSGYPIAAYLIEKNFKVTGIDGSKELLKIAQENYPNLECICGDIRTVELTTQYDAIIEWWCLFHLPKLDQLKMISRFSRWLKIGRIVEFTTGDADNEIHSSDMLEQELSFYSCDPKLYEEALKENGFEILLKESDQDQHLVWIARKIK